MTMAISMERKAVTARALYEAVREYIDSNKHSRDVAERWLCSVLEPQTATISAIMNNHPRADDQPAIEAFRAAELQEQIKAKQRELATLEADLEATKRRGAKAA
jgi:hypothetical protein